MATTRPFRCDAVTFPSPGSRSLAGRSALKALRSIDAGGAAMTLNRSFTRTFNRSLTRSLTVRTTVVLAACAALVLGGVTTAGAAASDSPYYVMGTDIGIYPRAGTSMAAGKVGAALSEGAGVEIACEMYGETVDNGYAPSDVWAMLPDGTYLPTAFVYTGYDGRTAGVPLCDAAAVAGVSPEQAESVEGIYVVNDGAMWNQLLNNYYSGSGATVELDWSLFQHNSAFASWALSQPADNTERSYASNAATNGFDMWASLGTFAVRRTSENCFVVRDVYDFNLLGFDIVQAIDGYTGAATVFDVNSSGCNLSSS